MNSALKRLFNCMHCNFQVQIFFVMIFQLSRKVATNFNKPAKNVEKAALGLSIDQEFSTVSFKIQ